MGPQQGCGLYTGKRVHTQALFSDPVPKRAGFLGAWGPRALPGMSQAPASGAHGWEEGAGDWSIVGLHAVES